MGAIKDNRYVDTKMKISLIATIIIIFLIAVAMWLSEIDMIEKIDISQIIFLCILTILPFFIYALTLRVLLEILGIRKSFEKVYLILTASFAANYTIPLKIGIPLRVYLYKKILGVPIVVGATSMILEILLWLIIPVSITLIALLTIFPVGEFIILPILILILMILVIFSLFHLDKFLAIIPFGKKFMGKICTEDIFDNLKRFKKRHVIVISSAFLSLHIISAIRLFLLFGIYGVNGDILQALIIQSISLVIGTLSLVPMGLGTKDVSLLVLMENLGITTETAISIVLLERILTTGVGFLLGMISISILSLEKLKMNPLKRVHRDSIK